MTTAPALDLDELLGDGDRPPAVVVPPPGPVARAWAGRLAAAEAPGINTLGPPGSPAPILWRAARGANVLDVDGNRYVDLTSGFGAAAVGHRHPRVTAAVAAQAGELVHGLGDVHAHPRRVELAERLAALAPVDDARVHFAVSGADAVEVAVKTAVLATGRPGVVAFDPGYHGLTLGALAATSRAAFRRPFAAQLHPHVRRLPFGAPPAALDGALAGGDVAAVLVEPIVGREGVLLPPAGWLGALADACRRHGALLVADEIFTGFGRTGHLFAVDAEGVRPDLVCCGKALGGGLPIGAAVGRRELMEAWRTDGEALHTGTFVGHPLAAAAALAVLGVIEDEGLVERATRLGEVVGRRLGRLAGPTGAGGAVEVRGRGLVWAVEVDSAALAGRWVRAALGRGILALASGPEGRVLQVAPPLTIAEPLLETALDLLAEAWDEAREAAE